MALFDRDADGVEGTPSRLTGRRILILFPHFTTLGGAGIYTLKLAELFCAEGALVGIVTLSVEKTEYAFPRGVEVISLDGPLTSSLAYWALFPYWQKKINDAIRRWRPDVLIPQVFPANWWGWLYKRDRNETALLWICHEPSAFIHSKTWISALKPPAKRMLARLLQPVFKKVDCVLSRCSDRIVANSGFTAGQVERVYHVKPAAIAYPAIDFTVYRPSAEVRGKGLVTVAKLTRFKRIDFLLRVFALVARRHPELQYHIVGRGDDQGRLRCLAEELGVASKVVFHTGLDNDGVAALMARCLLFLHGSIEEPFGMAPLEAIACGTPVVAHKSGGPLEFVNDSCGRLVDSLDEKVWCDTLSALIDRLEREPEYFQHVHEQVKDFRWEVTLQPIVSVVSEMCSGRSRDRQ